MATASSVTTSADRSRFAEAKQPNSLSVLKQFQQVRTHSEAICYNLADEDLQAQSMPDASPLKWHLAHTTWAFETFLLKAYKSNYKPFDAQFEYLFNSYYNAIGEQYPRPQRGLLTRPTRKEVIEYRHYVDQQLIDWISNEANNAINKESIISLLCLLINHEQQHQELMLTDLKHLFFFNPISIKLENTGSNVESFVSCPHQSESIAFDAGIYEIGHQNEDFYFDNEGPRHRVYLEKFALDSALVSNQTYLEFIEDGGYQKPEYWLSEAWYQIKHNQMHGPLYWRKKSGKWYEHSLMGDAELVLDAPVKHINYFEACALASWKNKRLPTEQEWEAAATSEKATEFVQLLNCLWQWTSSAYNAYPGFKPVEGAIGEYNGKFMVNQYVLRGGSRATPENHIRPSYRNFFYPTASWQFSGIRLAETL